MDCGVDDFKVTSENNMRNALNIARQTACYIIDWKQDQDPIHEWVYQLGLLIDPYDRLEEAKSAYNASHKGRPFHRITEIYLSTAERDVARWEAAIAQQIDPRPNIIDLPTRRRVESRRGALEKLAAD